MVCIILFFHYFIVFILILYLYYFFDFRIILFFLSLYHFIFSFQYHFIFLFYLSIILFFHLCIVLFSHLSLSLFSHLYIIFIFSFNLSNILFYVSARSALDPTRVRVVLQPLWKVYELVCSRAQSAKMLTSEFMLLLQISKKHKSRKLIHKLKSLRALESLYHFIYNIIFLFNLYFYFIIIYDIIFFYFIIIYDIISLFYLIVFYFYLSYLYLYL